MDKSIYEYCDLTEDEIVEREKRLDAERTADAERLRKGMKRARDFCWRGGMA